MTVTLENFVDKVEEMLGEDWQVRQFIGHWDDEDADDEPACPPGAIVFSVGDAEGFQSGCMFAVSPIGDGFSVYSYEEDGAPVEHAKTLDELLVKFVAGYADPDQ